MKFKDKTKRKNKTGFLLECTLTKKEQFNRFDAVRFAQEPHRNIIPYEYGNSFGGFRIRYRYDTPITSLKSYLTMIQGLSQFCELIRLFHEFIATSESEGISLKSILFDINRVYLSVEQDGPVLLFVYLPLDGGMGGLTDALAMLESLPKRVKAFKGGAFGDVLSDYAEFFSMPEAFSSIQFENLITKIESHGDGSNEAQDEPLSALAVQEKRNLGYAIVGEEPSSNDSRSTESSKEKNPTEILLRRESTGESWTIGESAIVGADERCQICILDNPTISHRHASLLVDKESATWYVRDDGSTNGTFVNDQKIAAQTPCLIKSGDRITFSHELFTCAYVDWGNLSG